MSETFVEEGVTLYVLPILSRDELEKFTADPSIPMFHQPFASIGTRVDMSDIVHMGSRTYVGIGNNKYVTLKKAQFAPDIAVRPVSWSLELMLFVTAVTLYMAIVFWYIALPLIVATYILFNICWGGAAIRWFLGNPAYKSIRLSGPTGSVVIKL